MADYPSLALQFPQSNLLDTASKVFQLNQLMNQNKLFQLQLAGKQRLGQIASQSVDDQGNFSPDTFFNNALRDPVAAPFAGEALQQMRAAQQTEQAMQVQRAETMGKAWVDLRHRLASAAASPNFGGEMLTPILKEWGAQYPDWMQKQIGAPAADLIRSITATPDGSPASAALVKARLGQLGADMTSEEYQHAFGTPSTQTYAGSSGINQPNVGVTAPAATGGAFTPAGGAPMTALPQGMTPEAAQTPTTTPSGTVVRAGNALPPVVSSGGGNAPNGSAAPGIASPVQQGYLEARGKELGQYQATVDNNVTTMAQMMTTVKEAQKAMQDFKPGGGAETYAKIASFAQALGAPQWLVDKIGNGDLSASQEFNKLMVDTTMSRIRAALMGIGGSRINQQEFEKFEANNPNIDVDPRAIDKIFKFWNHVYQMSKDEQSSFRQHVKAGKDIQDWPTAWQDTLQNKYGIGESEALSATSGMLDRSGKSFNSLAELQAAVKAGSVPKSDAINYAKTKGWVQ